MITTKLVDRHKEILQDTMVSSINYLYFIYFAFISYYKNKFNYLRLEINWIIKKSMIVDEQNIFRLTSR